MSLSFPYLRRTAVLLVTSSALFTQRIVAQNPPAAESTSAIATLPSAPQVITSRQHPETSVSLGAMAQLAATRISDTKTSLTTQSLAPSAGVFATFRQSFKPWLGYSVNFGYARPTYRSTASPGSFTLSTTRTLVPANMYEISVSYIAQRHLTNHLTAFGEAGGGTIGFAAIKPAGYSLRRSNAFLPEGIAGFGVDYHLAHGFGVRAQYRGLFVKYPFPDDSNSLRLHTVISEPTLSVTYTFGKHFNP